VGRSGKITTGARRASATIGAVALVGLGLLGTGGIAAAATPSLVTLSSEVVTNLAASTDTGAVSSSTPMTVGVGMVTDTAARNAAYTALFDPTSPTYHQFYTPASFNAAFGVDQAAADRVRAYVTRDGLHVVYANPDGSYMELSGTTGAVDSTFALTEHIYQGPSGSTFTANNVGPTVPSDVAGVSGLTSLTVATTPKLTTRALSTTKAAAAAHATAARKASTTKASTTKASTPADDTCEAPDPTGVAAGTDVCVGALTPQDVRDVYKVPSGDLGAGQKVAIFGEGELANVISDLRVFESTYNQPVVPVRELLIGDDLSDSSGDGEWDLDSQAITGMSPDLQELDFYFGSSLSDPSITATYNAWVNDPEGPLTGNSSFGGSEQLEYLGGFLEDSALQQADMEGRTMFTSAGDVGGSCLPGANGATNTGAPCVEYPASSPYVVGVGGTVLYTQATVTGAEVEPAQRALEYSWTYSGGGRSDFEAAPSWQTPAFPTGLAADVCAAGPGVGKSCRGVPDVSALSGDIVTNGYAYVNMGAVSEEGGTSLSSPLWAGSWANVQAAFQPNTTCANKSLVTATPVGSSAGFAAPELYAVGLNTTADPASFFDVGGTSDSVEGAGNGQQVSLPRSPVDPSGYDFVSGLGSPILSGLIDNLDCGHLTATTPTVYPTTSAGDLTVIEYGTTPPYDTPAEEGCSQNGQLSDPTGDATIPDPGGDAYDLTQVSLTSDSASTTFATTVVDATSDAANDVDYAFEFTYGANQYAVTVDTGASPTAELYELETTSTPAGLDVQVVPTALAALTPVIDTATNTISTTMPFTTFNTSQTPAPSPAYGIGSQLEQVAVFSAVGPALTALSNDFNVDPIDQADFLQCPYNVVSSAPSTLAESPLTALLPFAGIGIVAVFVGRRRRRSAGAAA
jgi:pseudomonalisin